MRLLPALPALLMLSLLAGCMADGGLTPQGSIAELKRIDDRVGTGPVASAGHQVTVHYTGWLYQEDAVGKRGQQFDSSRRRGEPFTFPLGAGKVIRGWDEGVAGMRVGGQRTLLVPAELGYGRKGAGTVIPANASLVFEVELLDVQPR